MNLNGMIEAATSAASNISLYDIKAGIRKIQNAVMNLSELEAKVREATNNEPWGASSSLMQEIADSTYSHHPGDLEDILRMIQSRFQEKSVDQWRQIYKSLQLLEYLIINGADRFWATAKATFRVETYRGSGPRTSGGDISPERERKSRGMLRDLRSFQYIDEKGQDQGENVRKRAKEVENLLWDTEKLEEVRRKARENRGKYTGVQGGPGFGGGLSSSSSRFGGFSGDSGYNSRSSDFGGSSRGVYGDGGGFGGEPRESRVTYEQSDKFEEYDEFEGSRPAASSRNPRTKPAAERTGVRKTTGSSKKVPEVDLVSFDEPLSSHTAQAPVLSTASDISSLANTPSDDDDFDDFQSATPATHTSVAEYSTNAMPVPITSTASSAQLAAPKPVSAPQQANLSGMVGLASISPPIGMTSTPVPSFGNASAFNPMIAPTINTPAFNTNTVVNAMPPTASQPSKLTGYQSTTPNYFQSAQFSSRPTGSSSTGGSTPLASASTKPSAGSDAFQDLWPRAGNGTNKYTSAGPAMGQLAKEKSSASIWGASAVSSNPTEPTGQQTKGNWPAGSSAGGNNDLDDLLG